MSGENGNGNGNGARVRELAFGEIRRAAGLVTGIGVAVWGVATWSQSVQTKAQSGADAQKAIEQLQQGLAQSATAVTEIRGVLLEQQRTLGKVVDFMDSQTQTRRYLGAQEQQRVRMCREGALKPERCQALPTDAEVEAMLR